MVVFKEGCDRSRTFGWLANTLNRCASFMVSNGGTLVANLKLPVCSRTRPSARPTSAEEFWAARSAKGACLSGRRIPHQCPVVSDQYKPSTYLASQYDAREPEIAYQAGKVVIWASLLATPAAPGPGWASRTWLARGRLQSLVVRTRRRKNGCPRR